MGKQRKTPAPCSKAALKAVVLYSELESGLKARKLLQRASRHAGWTDAMESVFWRLDVMAEPAVAREALYRAMDADMVLIVVQCMPEPPEWLLEWLEVWVVSRRIQDAILAAWCVSLTPHDKTTGIRILRTLSRRYGLSFLCPEDMPAPPNPALLEAAPKSG